jgi:hypothetical protein
VESGGVLLTLGKGASLALEGGLVRNVERQLDSKVFTPGAGHVIACNFNGIHRDMNRGDFRLVWNALINWNALPNDSP